MSLTIDGKDGGSTVADSGGGFRAPVRPGQLEIGRHEVVANCGVILAAPLDLILATQVESGTATLALILFFLVVGLALYRRLAFLQ